MVRPGPDSPDDLREGRLVLVTKRGEVWAERAPKGGQLRIPMKPKERRDGR